MSSILTCNLIYVKIYLLILFRYFFHYWSDCGELCTPFDPYSFFEIYNFFKFTHFFSFLMAIYRQIIILLAYYRTIRICTITNILKMYSTRNYITIKLSFFEFCMATRTICSSSETSNVLFLINRLLSPHMLK